MMIADNRFDYLEKVRYGLGYVTTPIYWVADTPARVSNWIDDVFVSRTDLVEENASLREQLLLSQRQLQLLESLASENSRLRAMQDSARTVKGEVLPAEIINMSPDPFSKRILINKGSDDGVYVGQALLDAYGLMGQVDEVLPFTAWVLLITDFHHVTPVQVNRNGERALARGSRTTSEELELEFVTQTQDIEVGDRLVSSGMGQVYPKDYPVAEVTSVNIDPGKPYVDVKARPMARIDSARNVMLVFADDPEQLQPVTESPAPGTDNSGDSELATGTDTETADTIDDQSALAPQSPEASEQPGDNQASDAGVN